MSDRETRKAQEAKWQAAGVDPRQTGDPKVDRKMGDLDRSLKGTVAGRVSDLDRAIQMETKGGPGAFTVPKVAGLPIGGAYAPGFERGTKIDRPMIVGGCSHAARTPAFTLKDGRSLYGAQGGQITEAGHLDLILDCAGMVRVPKAFIARSTNPKYRKLNGKAWPDVVRLDWPDMTAPTGIGIRFWQELHRMLPPHTAVACMGGHGRTGTALAAILVADGMGGDEAIKAVRGKHCTRAIETREQEAYIRALAQARDAQTQRGKR